MPTVGNIPGIGLEFRVQSRVVLALLDWLQIEDVRGEDGIVALSGLNHRQEAKNGG